MTKEIILDQLSKLKPKYEKEGLKIYGLFGSYAHDQATSESDIDILVEATPEFAARYGFLAIARLKDIEKELSNIFGIKVDLSDRSGMGQTAKKFIIDRTIYV